MTRAWLDHPMHGTAYCRMMHIVGWVIPLVVGLPLLFVTWIPNSDFLAEEIMGEPFNGTPAAIVRGIFVFICWPPYFLLIVFLDHHLHERRIKYVREHTDDEWLKSRAKKVFCRIQALNPASADPYTKHGRSIRFLRVIYWEPNVPTRGNCSLKTYWCWWFRSKQRGVCTVMLHDSLTSTDVKISTASTAARMILHRVLNKLLKKKFS